MSALLKKVVVVVEVARGTGEMTKAAPQQDAQSLEVKQGWRAAGGWPPVLTQGHSPGALTGARAAGFLSRSLTLRLSLATSPASQVHPKASKMSASDSSMSSMKPTTMRSRSTKRAAFGVCLFPQRQMGGRRRALEPTTHVCSHRHLIPTK